MAVGDAMVSRQPLFPPAGAGLSAPPHDRDVADLGTLFGNAVPDLSVDGQRGADAVFAAQEELGMPLRLAGRKAVVVGHEAGAPGRLFKALAQRIVLPVESAEAVDYGSPVRGTDAPYSDADADNAFLVDSILPGQLIESPRKASHGFIRIRLHRQSALLRKDHAAVKAHRRDDGLPQVDQHAQGDCSLRIQVDQNLPTAGAAALQDLALQQQPLLEHLADDLGDGRRGQVHMLGQTLARHGPLLMENSQCRTPVAALDAD